MAVRRRPETLGLKAGPGSGKGRQRTAGSPGAAEEVGAGLQRRRREAGKVMASGPEPPPRKELEFEAFGLGFCSGNLGPFFFFPFNVCSSFGLCLVGFCPHLAHSSYFFFFSFNGHSGLFLFFGYAGSLMLHLGFV